MKAKIESYRDLEAWKKSMDLVEKIYFVTKKFPADEKFGLTSQMRRAAVSIPSNIAEGYRRNGKAEFARFVTYAFGSGGELETQLELASRIKYISYFSTKKISADLDAVMRILNGLLKSIR